MGQTLHGGATTTQTIRVTIELRQAIEDLCGLTPARQSTRLWQTDRSLQIRYDSSDFEAVRLV
jgi:hypothetical protein